MQDHSPHSRPNCTDAAHTVQLFDSTESLTDTVADYLGKGLVVDDTLLAVMDEQRWYAVAMRMAARGFPLDEALESGQLTVRSAAETLKEFMREGRPDPALFAASTGELVARLGMRGRHLRIYGEMVDLLAAGNEYEAAEELEGLWNQLGTRQEFSLLCGYSAAHFGDPRQAAALRRICATHCGVLVSPQDVLGSFLVQAYRAG
jgi:hypothetical protein